ncbi:hypothetical protein AWB76_00202 [Caballeronia temeraria]|uniref:Uncharacterized protein n=1 Tax=Caballeronia temeraria TaxID=1777137 RepID=A0A157Z5D0_9BURK|nr:hypothetical protein [Caballeronia temeraria]SAK40725.1 hypothetical protein AWB76_00202 [Caballeronia temeraria]
MTMTHPIPLYDDERSWRATYGEPLFDSDQSMRTFTYGERRNALIEKGLVFIVKKRLVTDAPEALFAALVEMKKDAARERVRATPAPPPVNPVKPKNRAARVKALLREHKGNPTAEVKA